jgi:hypothetical protein
MFHPISVQAIRQSLEAGGMPRPAKVVQVGQQKMPDGRIISNYVTLMDEELLEVVRMEFADVRKRPAISYVEVLNSCFASDVYVTAVYPSQYRGMMRIELMTTLRKRDPRE